MFEKYNRKGVSELRPITKEEAERGLEFMAEQHISVSQADIDNGSPLLGDFVARNPKNHKDQWLVAAQYVKENLEKR